MNLTKNDLRDRLFKANVSIRMDKDGDFVTVLHADKDYKHDVLVFFILNEDNNTLTMMGGSEFDISPSQEDEALSFLNDWNASHKFGKAYLYEKNIRISACLDEPGNVSADYLSDSFIKLIMSVFWRFFTEIGAKFDA